MSLEEIKGIIVKSLPIDALMPRFEIEYVPRLQRWFFVASWSRIQPYTLDVMDKERLDRRETLKDEIRQLSQIVEKIKDEEARGKLGVLEEDEIELVDAEHAVWNYDSITRKELVECINEMLKRRNRDYEQTVSLELFDPCFYKQLIDGKRVVRRRDFACSYFVVKQDFEDLTEKNVGMMADRMRSVMQRAVEEDKHSLALLNLNYDELKKVFLEKPKPRFIVI